MFNGLSELYDTYVSKNTERNMAKEKEETLKKKIEEDKATLENINICALISKKTVEKKRETLKSSLACIAIQYILI